MIGKGNFRFKFGQQTDGNCVAFTIDGKFTFGQIYQHMYRAKSRIRIISYDLDPALRFARKYSDEKEDGVVRSKCARNLVHPFPQEDARKNSLETLLISKAREGVDVKVIVWQPRLIFRSLPGADERGIDGRAEEVESMDRKADAFRLKGALEVIVDSTAPTFTSAHHEKVIVVDGEVGFCGGIEMSQGKWDTSKHAYNSPLRDRGAEPWHDVGVLIRGPVVADLEYHFDQRWYYAQIKDASKVQMLTFPDKRPPATGNVPIMAVRTWQKFEKPSGIMEAYEKLFKKAKFDIYIENQFPFQDDRIACTLIKRLQENKMLRVVIVAPLEPNLPGIMGKVLSGVSVNDVNRNLDRIKKAGGRRVRTYCLITETKTSPVRRRQIYVHSKLMIVDDEWILVGSANLDKNGMRDSSEVNLEMRSAELAKDLRIRLWSEHTGHHVSIPDIARPNIGFQELDRIAASNGKRILEKRQILGHLYYYDFEERGFPAPYDNAKSITKLLLP